MNGLEKVEEIAQQLQREPYNLLTNDCLIKSLKLRRQCGTFGIRAKIVACIGIVRAKVFNLWWLTIPVIHGWVEVNGQRVEVSRPRGASGTWGIIPANIKPVIKLRF